MSDDIQGESAGAVSSAGAGEAGQASASSAGADQPASDSSTAVQAGEAQSTDIIKAGGGAESSDNPIPGGEPSAVTGGGTSSRTSPVARELYDARTVGGYGGQLMRPVRTSEEARALVRRRWDAAAAVARAELAESGGGSVAKGWGGIVRAQIGQAKGGKAGSTSAAAFVGRAAGLLERQQGRAAESSGASELSVSVKGQAVESLLGLLAGLGRRSE